MYFLTDEIGRVIAKSVKPIEGYISYEPFPPSGSLNFLHWDGKSFVPNQMFYDIVDMNKAKAELVETDYKIIKELEKQLDKKHSRDGVRERVRELQDKIPPEFRGTDPSAIINMRLKKQ